MLDGHNWLQGTGTAAGMKISLDGRNLSPAIRIASNGTFTVSLPPILVPGRHHIIVTQAVKSKPPVEAKLDFSVVSVDPPSEAKR